MRKSPPRNDIALVFLCAFGLATFVLGWVLIFAYGGIHP